MNFHRLFPALLFLSALSSSQTTVSHSFAPLERWKAAVLRSDSSALRSLYSTSPPAQVSVVTKGTAEIPEDSDIDFWTGLHARRMELKMSQSDEPQPGIHRLNFEATIHPAAPGRTLYVLESQVWQLQGNDWKLVAVQRTDERKLEQPLNLDAHLYDAGVNARQEIQQALSRAAKAHKRVLVVFGADWCYDCHVLDKAFRRPDIAPVLNPNFEVVHVDVGQGDKNQDLMNEYQVPMSRGIPGIAVLDANGKLIFSQKNGEFERTRAMGPEDLLAFLNQWKPSTR